MKMIEEDDLRGGSLVSGFVHVFWMRLHVQLPVFHSQSSPPYPDPRFYDYELLPYVMRSTGYMVATGHLSLFAKLRLPVAP